MPAALSKCCLPGILAALLAAVFCFGLGIIAITPPFEGLDESAHFSRLQSQAFAPQSLLLDDTLQHEMQTPSEHITTDVFDYYRKGPMPYYWITSAQIHIHDPLYNILSDNPEKDFTTYRDFFASPSRIAGYTQAYWQSPLPRGYRAAEEPDWQYQHPFLYYVVVGQAMKLLAGHVSMITAVLVMRLFSWLLAFAGLAIALVATRSHLVSTDTPRGEKITALGALYPFFMPMFFWEFARMGNDSMCLFIFGIVWALLLRHFRAPKSRAGLLLGIFLGLGWLAKALMIPTSLGIVAMLGFRAIRAAPKKDTTPQEWISVLKIAALMMLIGAPLYIASHLYSGSIGAQEFTNIMGTNWRSGLGDLGSHADHILDSLDGIFSMAVWMFGTWSFMVIDLPIQNHKYVYFFTILVVLAYCWALLRRRVSTIAILPLWTIGPLLLGLLVHILAVVVIDNNDLTPGYYLHVLAPALALVFGIGLNTLTGNRYLAAIMWVYAAMLILFNFFIAWSYATVFAGCSVPVNEDPFYLIDRSEVFQCAHGWPEIIGNLDILAWPYMAITCFGLTALLLLTSAVMAIGKRKPA